MINYQIVPMDKQHIPTLAALESQSFSHPWTAQQLEEGLYQDHLSFLVAEGEEIYGYAGLTVVLDEGYINNVAVFPQYHRQGIATAMLEVFCRFAQAHLAFLSLEVRPSNAPALTLYQSLGFVEQGRRKDYYQDPVEDALILTKFFREVDS